MSETNWGEVIERAYQTYLNYGCHNKNWAGWEMYSTRFYDQLVEDKYLNKDAWREQMPHARSFIIGRLQRHHAVQGMRYSEDLNTRSSELSGIEHEIRNYRDGKYDAKVMVLAKQRLTLKVFKEARKRNLANLYVNTKS